MTFYPTETGGRGVAAIRWTGAVVFVVALHLGAAWWIFDHSFVAPPPPDQPLGVTIDLEPIAIPQNAPQPSQTAAAGAAPQPQQQAATKPAEQTPPDPTPPDPTPPPPPVAEPTPPPPDPTPPPPDPTPPPPPQPEVVPQLPVQENKSDAVLTPPPPAPKPEPPKPDPRIVARQLAARRAEQLREQRQAALEERQQQERQQAKAEARAQAKAARAAQAREAQQAGGRSDRSEAPSNASSGASVSSWRGEVMARLNAFKPSSPDGSHGTARVSFSVDRNGRVVGAGLAGSSGDGALDQAAVSMVRRASPLPAPPSELGGRVNLSVPVRFD